MIDYSYKRYYIVFMEIERGTLLNSSQVADYIGLKPTTIRRKALKNAIPHIRIHGRLRFDKQEIDRWLLSNSRGRQAEILVVDDDPGIEQLFRFGLGPYNEFHVTAVSDGVTALGLIANQRFDIMFLDLVMPKISGVDVLGKIREEDKFVPVVIITGNPDSELLRQANEYQPLTIMIKPFTVQQIIQTVRAFVHAK